MKGLKLLTVLLLCVISSLGDDRVARCRDICSRAFVVCPPTEDCKEGYIPKQCVPDTYSCCSTCVKGTW